MCNNTLVEFPFLVFHLIWVRRGSGGLGGGGKAQEIDIRREPYWKLSRDVVEGMAKSATFSSSTSACHPTYSISQRSDTHAAAANLATVDEIFCGSFELFVFRGSRVFVHIAIFMAATATREGISATSNGMGDSKSNSNE